MYLAIQYHNIFQIFLFSISIFLSLYFAIFLAICIFKSLSPFSHSFPLSLSINKAPASYDCCMLTTMSLYLYISYLFLSPFISFFNLPYSSHLSFLSRSLFSLSNLPCSLSLTHVSVSPSLVVKSEFFSVGKKLILLYTCFCTSTMQQSLLLCTCSEIPSQLTVYLVENIVVVVVIVVV